MHQLAPIQQTDWQVMKEQAAMLVRTGFLPRAVDTPEKAIAIMMKGQELRIPPMYALSNVTIIQGKPTANAELMLALIYRDHGDQAIDFVETDDAQCTIRYKRATAREYRAYTFTMAQAKQAGLLSNQTWQKYPAAMLRARCISAVARLAFPDTIAGMYTPEELGATVNADGEVIDVPAAQPPQIAVAPAPNLDKLIRRLMELQHELTGLDPDFVGIDYDDLADYTKDQLVTYGKDLRARIDAAILPPEPELFDGPDAAPVVTKAEQDFFERFGQVIGSQWSDVQTFFGRPYPRPTTPEGWQELTEAVDNRLELEAAQVEG